MIFAAETRDGRQRWRRLAETFLKVKFHFFWAHIFLHPTTLPSKVTSSSTTLYIHLPQPPPSAALVLPQNIHFHLHLRHFNHVLYLFFLFFFHQHNKHRPSGEQCKSRNSVKLLRNALCFHYPDLALIYCHSTTELHVFSPPLIRDSDVEFCCSRTKTRPKGGKSDSRDVFMAVCGDTRDLCKLSSLTSCCPRKHNKVFFLQSTNQVKSSHTVGGDSWATDNSNQVS